ncbi:MAG: hypothetical protein LBG58_07980, partial [Planctomycetaceae bacterium]|nr:hypothetical protein [Planctomycetaceae bacterium]
MIISSLPIFAPPPILTFKLTSGASTLGKNLNLAAKKSFGIKFFSFVLALAVCCCLFVPTAKGTTYDVGAGKTYANLEYLRQSVTSSMWADDDEIVLYGDDNSLTDAFNFGGKRIQISGMGKISPYNNASNIRFFYEGNTNPLLLTLGDSIS